MSLDSFIAVVKGSAEGNKAPLGLNQAMCPGGTKRQKNKYI
jgi:hypothetical protein